MRKSPTLIYHLSAIALLLYACSGEPKSTEGIMHDTSSLKKALTSDEDAMAYKLPSPLQLASIFKKAGLKYMEGNTNPTENISKYNTGNFTRAINLGVYSADLAYYILNNKSQESKRYLKACRDIGADLGLQKAFESNNLGKRFDNNVGREDSLLSIVSDIQLEIDNLLEENKQKHITAIAFAGAWIESVYIAGKIHESDKNKNVGISLMEQFNLVPDIIKALKANEDKEQECKALIADFDSIIALFKGTQLMKSNKDEEPDFTKAQLSDSEFTELEKKITEVRNKLVK